MKKLPNLAKKCPGRSKNIWYGPSLGYLYPKYIAMGYDFSVFFLEDFGKNCQRPHSFCFFPKDEKLCIFRKLDLKNRIKSQYFFRNKK